MKKIISIALAIVMMMAICVPAFATQTIDKSTAQSVTSDVITSKQDVDGNDAYTYQITFPASYTFAWNDTNAKDASYSVTSQLLIGASLDVAVAYDTDADTTNDGVMAATGTTETLTYTLTGAGTAHFAEVNENAKASDVNGTDATIKIASYADVPVAEYKGTVTYSVTYNAPTTP